MSAPKETKAQRIIEAFGEWAERLGYVLSVVGAIAFLILFPKFALMALGLFLILLVLIGRR